MRAGSASDVIATRGPIQNDESRVNSRFGKRVDDEVAAVVHAPHQRQFPAVERQLVERHARHQHVRQRRGIQRAQVRREFLRQWQAQSSRVDRRRNAVHAGGAAGQRLGQQFAEQQHLDATRPQQVGERVVLLLRLGHPGQPVEQQRVVVARSQSLQFGPRAVQDRRPAACPPRNWHPAPFPSHLAP